MKSEQINELAAALAKAQGEIKSAAKDSTNPHFKSKYADLASVWDACRAALSKNGLSVAQITATTEAGKVRVTTTLMHSSGQWIEGDLDVKPMQDTAQGIGSTVTYCRRYALAAMVGVAPDDDDDGNAASERPNGVKPIARAPVPPQTSAAPPEGRFHLMHPNGRVASSHNRASDWLTALETEMGASDQPHLWWAVNGADAKQIAIKFPQAADKVAELEELASFGRTAAA